MDILSLIFNSEHFGHNLILLTFLIFAISIWKWHVASVVIGSSRPKLASFVLIILAVFIVTYAAPLHVFCHEDLGSGQTNICVNVGTAPAEVVMLMLFVFAVSFGRDLKQELYGFLFAVFNNRSPPSFSS